MGLKVLSIREFVVSHILFVGGLVLLTIGLYKGIMALNIISIWAFVLGLCLGFSALFKKLVAKQ